MLLGVSGSVIGSEVVVCSLRSDRRTFNALLHLPLHSFGMSSLDQLRRFGHATVPGIERAFEHPGEVDMDEFGRVPDFRTNEFGVRKSNERQKNLGRSRERDRLLREFDAVAHKSTM